MNSRSQTTLVGNDLDSLITSFTTAREALEGTHCQVLENAVDKLLKLALAAKRAKASTADSQPLTIVMWRFYQDLLRPICSAGKEAEIRFAPAMRHHIEILCSRICAAVEVTSLFKSKLFRRLPPKQDIATAAEQISGALDQFGNNESMTANIVKEGKMKFVLLQDKSTGPVPLDQEEEDPDPGNRQRVTNDILKQCPKQVTIFISNPERHSYLYCHFQTGTGKSSLINRTFNVDIAKVSHFKAGEADINLEITSPDNDRFILHDSQGFEPGELKNLGIVKDFIRRRNMMPALQDKIHAVWLCIQVPFAQGRLLETGDEQFLKADFGLPVIVVFTKYDILSSTKEKEVLESPAFDTWSDDEVDAKVENACKYEYDKVCIEPLRRETGGRSLPSAKVSIFDDASLAELVKLTSQHARERVGEAVWLTWAVAQRASVDLNVDASIA
ncbi:hypothetical protein FRB96_007073 [Tulasnella sp. 330]|nr:hypothetical protein FRB96_007073 [Tulasnella sp. 330]